MGIKSSKQSTKEQYIVCGKSHVDSRYVHCSKAAMTFSAAQQASYNYNKEIEPCSTEIVPIGITNGRFLWPTFKVAPWCVMRDDFHAELYRDIMKMKQSYKESASQLDKKDMSTDNVNKIVVAVAVVDNDNVNTNATSVSMSNGRVIWRQT